MSEPQTEAGRALLDSEATTATRPGIPRNALSDHIELIEAESRNATLDEVVRVVERLDGIVVLGGNAIANVHEPTREAVLDAVKALRG